MAFRQFAMLLSLPLAVFAGAEDETCDDLSEHGLLKLHELLDGEGCNAERAVVAIRELWNASTSMHETYDHLAQVELGALGDSKWAESCTACVKMDSCHLPSETLHCHTNPDRHFLADNGADGDVISAKNHRPKPYLF
ncbi:unnamed protein product [Effrenium voratum]|nr:unnamed protein product [Effrenium voratum]